MIFNRIHQILQWFKQPYPANLTIKGNLKVIYLLSGFVFLFLVIFQYGVFSRFDLYERIGYAALFSVLCSSVFVLNLSLFPKLFSVSFEEKNWKVWKEIVFALWHFFSIGSANTLLIISLGWVDLDTTLFIQQQLSTFAIGSIPITIYVLIDYNQSLQQQLKTALTINQQISQELQQQKQDNTPLNLKSKVTLKAKTKNVATDIIVQDLLYIVSEKNYIRIVTIEGDEVKEVVQRNTITEALKVFDAFPYIVKCHRAFIVNTQKIISAEGNSQGLQLKLAPITETIPVARNYVKTIRDLFK